MMSLMWYVPYIINYLQQIWIYLTRLYLYFLKVIKETGFINGLYTVDELTYEKIADKEAKIEFLQKLIDVVSKYL